MGKPKYSAKVYRKWWKTARWAYADTFADLQEALEELQEARNEIRRLTIYDACVATNANGTGRDSHTGGNGDT